MSLQLATDDPDYVKDERSCIIRVGRSGDDFGPVLYTDGNHAATGILSVERVGYDIVVTSDWKTSGGEETRGFGIEVDAQLAALGVTGGCSGGATTTIVRLYATRSIRRYPDSETNTAAVWVAGDQLPPNGNWADLDNANFTLTLRSVRPKTT